MSAKKLIAAGRHGWQPDWPDQRVTRTLGRLKGCLASGYDRARQWWFVGCNSWGEGRNTKGCFTLPCAGATDETSANNYWKIRIVQQFNHP